MYSITSKRIRLRPLVLTDAHFILRLLNDPDWLKYIGSRDVNNLRDAQQYIKQGPQMMYQQHNLGLLLVEMVEANKPLGLCGLLKRDTLAHPDLGFAFMPEYRGQGLAFEAARLIITDAFERGLSKKILAMTALNNDMSEQLLTKLGFRYLGVSEDMVDTQLFEITPTKS